MGIKVFDFDGVVTEGKWPQKENGDVIVTGRCLDECDDVYNYLIENGIPLVPVYFKPMLVRVVGKGSPLSRKTSGLHKSRIISILNREVGVDQIYEDDMMQIQVMKEHLSRHLSDNIVFVESEVEK